jgi:hypothetical protein
MKISNSTTVSSLNEMDEVVKITKAFFLSFHVNIPYIAIFFIWKGIFLDILYGL